MTTKSLTKFYTYRQKKNCYIIISALFVRRNLIRNKEIYMRNLLTNSPKDGKMSHRLSGVVTAQRLNGSTARWQNQNREI